MSIWRPATEMPISGRQCLVELDRLVSRYQIWIRQDGEDWVGAGVIRWLYPPDIDEVGIVEAYLKRVNELVFQERDENDNPSDMILLCRAQVEALQELRNAHENRT